MAYIFKFELLDMPVPVWRIVTVPDQFSLFRLHLAIQGAFGWDNVHLYEFTKKTGSKSVSYGDSNLNDGELEGVKEAANVFLHKLFKKPGDSLDYVYDFGDGWRHKIVLHAKNSEEYIYPVCEEGAGKCPPEDVGGPHGYASMLESLAKKSDPEKASYRTWLGLGPKEKWDPTEFDRRETHKRLCLVMQ